MKTETSIPEYKESIVGQMLQGIQLGAGQKAGDPVKLAEALIQIVETPVPSPFASWATSLSSGQTQIHNTA